MGERDDIRHYADFCRLEEALAARLHAISQIRLGRFQDVLAGSETTGNRLTCCGT